MTDNISCYECGKIGAKLYKHHRLPAESLCKHCIENDVTPNEDETIYVEYDESNSTFNYVIEIHEKKFDHDFYKDSPDTIP